MMLTASLTCRCAAPSRAISIPNSTTAVGVAATRPEAALSQELSLSHAPKYHHRHQRLYPAYVRPLGYHYDAIKRAFAANRPTIRSMCPTVTASAAATGLRACAPYPHMPVRAFSSINADELRAALRVLSLPDNCTDAELKTAFQAFAKANHPDTFAASSGAPEGCQSSNNGVGEAAASSPYEHTGYVDPSIGAAERMAAGTTAYRLLRTITFEERRMILLGDPTRRGGLYTYEDLSGPGRRRGDFQYSEEELARARAAYYGRPRPQSHSSSHGQRQQRERQERAGAAAGGGTSGFRSSGEYGAGSFDDPHLFSERAEQGRRRTAAFNQSMSRIEALRRRMGRGAAPWKVADGDGTYHRHPKHSAGGSAACGASTDSGDRRRPDANAYAGVEAMLREMHRKLASFCSSLTTFRYRFSYGPGFSLRFYFSSIRSDIAGLRKRYEYDKTCAGIHGNRYDYVEQEAKSSEERKHFPQSRRYLLQKHRAQERAVVDQSASRLISVERVAMSVLMLVTIAVALAWKRRAIMECEAMKIQREGEGGA